MRQRIIFLMLIVSVCVNVILARRLSNFNRAFNRTSARAVKPGTLVPAFEAVDPSGQKVQVTYSDDSKPTVLYIFTPPCTWCERNLDSFKKLVDQESGQFRFIALSLSDQGLTEYIAKNDLKLPVYSDLSSATKDAYGLGGTPQTLVVSPEGKVLQNWAGAYVGDQKSQVEAFFHVSLPGLRELPKAAEEKGQTAPQAN